MKLTSKGTFLTRELFQQLLYVAVCGLPGTEIVTSLETMMMPIPAVLRPVELWTGKQVVSALLSHMCRPPLPAMHLDGKARTPPTAFGEKQEEHIVIFRYGELLSGVMDKAAVGNVSLGIVHTVYELYGAELAGLLLTAFGRLFTYYLQMAGHSCGIEDLTLRDRADRERCELLLKVERDCQKGLSAFLEGRSVQEAVASADTAKEIGEVDRVKNQVGVGRMMMREGKDAKVRLDGAMQSVINKAASEVIKVCLPNGLEVPFPKNNFSMMVLTGAKGSAVNQSQISCFLGQQALEGQRVPVMISGKTLPSFIAYDPSARAGGFVRDRFLTGVKPQEFYFHCMAGREGLVDTAVKTSRSGYLQRCLVKHLEELRVNYDMTVRDSGGNIIQFLYGEDGLDPCSAALLGGKSNQMQFLGRNHHALVHKYSVHSGFMESLGLEAESAQKHCNRLRKSRELLNTPRENRTYSKKAVVIARKKLSSSLGWSRTNMSQLLYAAEVIKVRKPSMIVTSAPKDFQTDANSQPITPPPRTMTDCGT